MAIVLLILHALLAIVVGIQGVMAYGTAETIMQQMAGISWLILAAVIWANGLLIAIAIKVADTARSVASQTTIVNT